MRNYPFNLFKYGLFNKLPAEEIPDGAAYDEVNWLVKKGKIELNRGYAPLGTELTGSGRVTGLRVGRRQDGTEIPFYTYNSKVKYYSAALADWVEIGSDILGTGVINSAGIAEDISMERFDSRAGHQIWLNSPHSGPKKIMVTNPGDYADMYDSTKNYKAYLSIFGNQAFNFNIGGLDRNVVRLSYIETRNTSDYTQIVAEAIGTGDATTKTFTGTLGFKVSHLTRSALDVSMTDTNETFSEDLNGNLIGNLGGTGTINYMTGVFSITFFTAPAALAALTATYRWVDETAAGGIANFIVPGSRVSGDPNVFRQDTGGDTKAIFSLQEHRFCGHTKAFYDLTLNLDDTENTNNIFRENIGIPFLRAGYSTPEGIYTVDTSDDNNPRFVLISYSSASTDIKPKVISDDLNLVPYSFDQLVIFAYNDFILYSCRKTTSPYNDTTFVYNKVFGTFDKLDYAVSAYDIYQGTLIGGDSLSNNVFTLFSGLDADTVFVYNYWLSGISKLGTINSRGKRYPIRQQKKVKKVSLEGEIGPDQTIRMFVSLDRAPFVEIVDKNGRSFINGQGDYVDRSQRVNIGSPTIGKTDIGDGSDIPLGIEAYHYEREISFGQDKFMDIQIKFDCTGLGYASIIDLEFRDIRLKQDKPIRRCRQ